MVPIAQASTYTYCLGTDCEQNSLVHATLDWQGGNWVSKIRISELVDIFS